MSLDLSVLYALNSLIGRSPVLDQFILFCADYLAYVAIAVLLIVIWRMARPLREKLEILATTLGAGLVSRYGIAELIRHFYHRPRPFTALPGNVHSLFTDPSWSFPSGHASFFFALSTALYMYDRRLGIWFFIISVIIGIGRVAAGVHYPSDILGGAVLGIAVGYVATLIGRSFSKKIVIGTY